MSKFYTFAKTQPLPRCHLSKQDIRKYHPFTFYHFRLSPATGSASRSIFGIMVSINPQFTNPGKYLCLWVEKTAFLSRTLLDVMTIIYMSAWKVNFLRSIFSTSSMKSDSKMNWSHHITSHFSGANMAPTACSANVNPHSHLWCVKSLRFYFV